MMHLALSNNELLLALCFIRVACLPITQLVTIHRWICNKAFYLHAVSLHKGLLLCLTLYQLALTQLAPLTSRRNLFLDIWIKKQSKRKDNTEKI